MNEDFKANIVDICDAENFLEWFRSALEAWKGAGRSQRALADEANIAAPLLSNVLKGDRRLPPERIEDVARIFGKDDDDAMLIRTRYLAEHAATEAERAIARGRWEGRAMILGAKKPPAMLIDHWSNVAFREMCSFEEPPEPHSLEDHVARLRFPVSREQATAALALLQSDLVRKNGLYAEPMRIKGADRTIHQQAAALVALAAQGPKDDRQLNMYYGAVSDETLAKILEEHRAYMARVTEIAEMAPPEGKRWVVQVSAQVIPIAGPPGVKMVPEEKG